MDYVLSNTVRLATLVTPEPELWRGGGVGEEVRR